MVGALLPFLGSVVGGFQQSANIDKQIAANKAENRDTRLYNLIANKFSHEFLNPLMTNVGGNVNRQNQDNKRYQSMTIYE
jgi:hypothetical protein